MQEMSRSCQRAASPRRDQPCATEEFRAIERPRQVENTVLAGVFQLESAQAIPASELKDKYIALLKAQDKTYGYIVRGVRSDGQGGAGPGIDSIVKVTLDCRENPRAWHAFRHGVADGVQRSRRSVD